MQSFLSDFVAHGKAEGWKAGGRGFGPAGDSEAGTADLPGPWSSVFSSLHFICCLLGTIQMMIGFL